MFKDFIRGTYTCNTMKLGSKTCTEDVQLMTDKKRPIAEGHVDVTLLRVHDTSSVNPTV